VDHWPLIVQVALIFVATPLAVWACVHLSRKQGRVHASLIVFFALTAVALTLDGAATRLAYTAYDPRLWHLPTIWAPSAPTVEPFLALVTYGIFVLPGLLWTRSIQPRVLAHLGADSVAARHPLWLVFVGTFAFAFVSIAAMELFLTRAEIYVYTQVLAPLAVRAGTTWQYPLVLAAPPMAALMAVSAVLMWESDPGRSVVERIAHRIHPMRRFPHLASWIVATVILSVTYVVMFFGPYGWVYSTGAATTLARPWPYSDTKVFDPQGYYEREESVDLRGTKEVR
jgi:hypothetical protein